MKKISLFMVLILVLTLSGCGGHLADVATTNQQNEQNEQNLIQEKLNDPTYKYALIFCKGIKKNLLNPDSFILKEVVCCEWSGSTDCINYMLVYTGENRMGGRTEATAFCYYDFDEDVYTVVGDDNYDYPNHMQTWAYITGRNQKAKEMGFGDPIYLDEEFIMEHMDDK